MADYVSKDIRNVIAVGHAGSGKTTLLDQMLFKAGAVTRAGSVVEKNSIFDFEDEEKERQSSVFMALAYCRWKGVEFNLIDTPGYTDFVGAALCGLQAADIALLHVSATHGIELNTRRMNTASKNRQLARVILISKMDGENIVDYAGLVGRIKEALGAECVAYNLPIGVGPAFKGVVNVLQPPAQAPEGVLGDVAEAAAALMDKIVEADEKLMERFLNDEKLSPDELVGALRKAILQGTLVPILHVAGKSALGVEELMDFIASYLPSPVEKGDVVAKDTKKNEEVKLRPDPAAPLVAQVFKTVTDPFVGKLAYFRILQGTFLHDSHAVVARTGNSERVAQLFRVFGHETRPVTKGIPGDILAVARIENIQISDTLCAPHTSVELPKMAFPTPMVSLAAEPKARGDEQKISGAVQKLADEDPTLRLHRDQRTGELVVTGMSHLHLDVLLHRLNSRFGVGVTTKPPRIPYKETITASSAADYRHKKQSGGHGQFGEVWFKMEPRERGAGFEFVDAVVGGSIPNQYIPAVEKGVRETIAKGVLAGYPVEDVRVILHFGKYHDVDSSEAAFKLAASMCFQKAFMEAKPVLLEPIVTVEITVPSQNMGDIAGDLNSRRGRIIGMDTEGDMQIIRAHVPMSEVMNYATELRSMTGGTGGYTMEFSHYDVVPARSAEAVIAQHKREKEEAGGR